MTDLHPLHAALARATLGAPLSHGALTVLPLLLAGSPGPDWLTLGEAGGAVRITEVSEDGAVPHLSVRNAADRAVLLLDGEELIGSRQNRVLNTSVLVAAGTTATIPVSCVEQGRWAYRGRRSRTSGYALYASLRRQKAARVSASLRAKGRHDGDQEEVWQALRDKSRRLGARSDTGAMHEVFLQHAEQLAAAQAALAPVAGQAGAVVYLGGVWAGLDLLAAPGLFAKAWPRLSSGYAADALDRAPAPGWRPAPTEVLARLRTAPLVPAPSVGLGQEHRLGGRHVAGSALVVDGLVAHLAVFPAVD